MSDLRAIPDPIEYVTDLSHRRGRMEFMWADVPHWVRGGNLDHDAETFEVRDRFMYDYSWLCDQCRVHTERKEGGRILGAFRDDDAWVTVVDESDEDRKVGSVRGRIARTARTVGVSYVTVPIFTGHLVTMTTGNLLDESELVPDELFEDFIFETVMGSRWKFESGAGISSTRGFLPPARLFEFFEAFTKDPADRCWHLHETRDEATECAEIMSVEDGEGRRWYVRGTNRWHRIGRVRVLGEELEKLAEECQIGWTRTYSEVVGLMFEPLLWTDVRMIRFLDRAGWVPPHDGFVPPPIQIEFRVAAKQGLVSARSVPWKPVRGVS